MSYTNRGLKAIGLSLIAMAGFMAFMAAGASADWLESGKALTGIKGVAVKTHGTHGILLVPTETKLEILCKKVAAEDVLLPATGTTVSGGLGFSECLVFQNGAHSTACSPPNLVEPIKASGKGKLIAHGTETYVLFEPLVAGGNFAQVKFKAPCALPETNNVKGSLVVECRKVADLALANCLNEEKVHVLTQAPTELFPSDALTYGTKAAFLDGFIAAELTSTNLWSGHA